MVACLVSPMAVHLVYEKVDQRDILMVVWTAVEKASMMAES